MGEAGKDNRQKTKRAWRWGQVGWVLWWRHTGPSTSSAFIIHNSNTRRRHTSQGRVWHCNPREQEKPVTTSLPM
jgi:hypothetical protein